MNKAEANAKHQANVDAIKRRGVHDRVISKLHYWKSLECNGYVLGDAETKEVTMLTQTLSSVREDMVAAGQPPGQEALLGLLGLS